MWVKFDEKHKDGDVWLARNKYEEHPFSVAYKDVEGFGQCVVLATMHHVLVHVEEVWEE